MNETLSAAFSIKQAASEVPQDIGLICGDKEYTFHDLAQMIDDCELEDTIVAEHTLATIIKIYAALESKRPVQLVHPKLTKQERLNLPTGKPLFEDVLATIYTSGSSGQAKAVLLSRQSFYASAMASQKNLGWHGFDRWLLNLPLAHVGGLSVITRCLIARKPVVLGGTSFIDDCEQHRVSLASLVPTQLARLADRPAPKSLRAVLVGGATLLGELYQRARGNDWPLLSTYGMSETCSQVATWPLAALDATRSGNAVGKLLEGFEARILDGEIQLRGPALFSAYLNENRREPMDWFATGDLGHIHSDNWLEITGRKSDLIITGGENVQPREIESCFVNHGKVISAGVFGIADDEWGEIVCAVYCGDAEESELREYAQLHLAAHKQPKRYKKAQSLPLLDNGKLDRQTLKKLMH